MVIFIPNGCFDAYEVKVMVNPIPTGHGRNQPIYDCHVTTAVRIGLRINSQVIKKNYKQDLIIFGLAWG